MHGKLKKLVINMRYSTRLISQVIGILIQRYLGSCPILKCVNKLKYTQKTRLKVHKYIKQIDNKTVV